MRLSIPRFVAVAVLLLANAPALAESRVALLIANSAYNHAPHLATPANDADDIAGALKAIGFDVEVRKDVTAEGLRAALADFSEKSAQADLAILYFAGHSLNTGVDGYLIPVDAQLASAGSLQTEAVPFRAAIGSIVRARRLALFILDGQRESPFPAKFARHDAAAPQQGGETSAVLSNVLVLFAAEPTRQAQAGTGVHSPLAAALLKHLPEPDIEVNFLLRKVRDTVRNATAQKQTPYMYGQLSGGRIYLNPVLQKMAAVPSVDPASAQPCDRLAAAPEDAVARGLSVKGVALGDIDTAGAIVACSQAVRDFQGIDRFHYQLGRALYAARDYPAALASYKRAYELGNVRALHALGGMYDDGLGVDKDPARARFYYEVAAEMKFAPAIVSLAMNQERGIGGAGDPVKAYGLYRRAADLGDARALNRLGELTEKGLGIAVNVRQARTLYEKSAAKGDTEGMVNLARCYANGIGGRQDRGEARKLLTRAEQAGNVEAKAILQHLGAGKKP